MVAGLSLLDNCHLGVNCQTHRTCPFYYKLQGRRMCVWEGKVGEI